jgi:hypothetical protein
MKYLALSLLLAVLQTVDVDAQPVFRLAGNETSVYYAGSEKVVNTAIDMLIDDSGLVFGQPFSRAEAVGNNTIIVGIAGKEAAFDGLASGHRLDFSGIHGKWEAYQMQAVHDGARSYLFIAGSDPRGAAYGVLELSRRTGVSPWVWWADVEPGKKKEASIVADGRIHAPSVQYRGIFLNDEDWALMPWSTRTFEPTPVRGAIGPKTYARIFELLLRLRANTIWPAMHECTVPFFSVEGNKEAAEKYGIVSSTSHAEPMMRTNTGEWDSKKYGAFNFLTNKDRVLSYWEERVKQLAGSENIYTTGMRGIHDGRMQGVNSLDDETQTLQKVIAEQRNMLQRNNPGKSITAIPQIFVPYKEVLKAYDNGLKLPDDVTLVWCDDNNGYIMRLGNPDERKRSGGSGVYYHVSYWGKPHDYLWLGSTQPGLIYAEMKRAWDYGARRLWILNVGDIKPNEYLTEFFLDMAWDVDAFKGNTIYKHREDWVNRTFSGIESKEINSIIRNYYLLAARRKPEHMGWNRVEDRTRAAIADAAFSPDAFGDEMQKRIAAYDAIGKQSTEVYSRMSKELKPAYFQLVHYPVLASGAMNRKILYAQKSRIHAGSAAAAARTYADLATRAYNEIAALDYAYNKDMLRGKWELMMDMKPRDLPVFQPPVLPDLPAGKHADINELPVTGSYAEATNPYVERDRMIALNASQHTNRIDLETIEGLGHSGSAVRLPPAKALNDKSPCLEFKVTTTSAGAAKIRLGTIPWHPANGGDMRCAIVVNGQKSHNVVINAEFLSDKWAENVLRNQALNSTDVRFDAPGEHIIRIYAIDEEALIDQVMIEFDPARKHYLLPVNPRYVPGIN